MLSRKNSSEGINKYLGLYKPTMLIIIPTWDITRLHRNILIRRILIYFRSRQFQKEDGAPKERKAHFPTVVGLSPRILCDYSY